MSAIRDQKAADFMKHWGPVKKPKKVVKHPVPEPKVARPKIQGE